MSGNYKNIYVYTKNTENLHASAIAKIIIELLLKSHNMEKYRVSLTPDV